MGVPALQLCNAGILRPVHPDAFRRDAAPFRNAGFPRLVCPGASGREAPKKRNLRAAPCSPRKPVAQARPHRSRSHGMGVELNDVDGLSEDGQGLGNRDGSRVVAAGKERNFPGAPVGSLRLAGVVGTPHIWSGR